MRVVRLWLRVRRGDMAGGTGAVSAGLAILLLATPSAQQGRFSSGTLGVRVDVLVTRDHAYVGGLTAADFEVRDNGVRQLLDSADLGDAPLNAVLGLDMSASTTGARLSELLDASQRLMEGLRPVDRAALITFNHAVTPRVPLTSDFSAIRAALDRVHPAGDTAVLDSLYVALTTTLAEPGRSLVVVCTDGRDTASWLQPDDVLEAAKRSSAVVYAVAADRARGWQALKDITDVTGGRTIDVESGHDLAAQFAEILRDFRSRYVLTFVPAGVSDGGYHKLDVRVRQSGVSVKARPGYLGHASR